MVLELHDAGMSIRAIVSITGASRTTVISDIRSGEVVQSVPPEPAGRFRVQVADDR